jgi:hypothetical protein
MKMVSQVTQICLLAVCKRPKESGTSCWGKEKDIFGKPGRTRKLWTEDHLNPSFKMLLSLSDGT